MPNIITGHNDVLIVLGATNGGWCIYAGNPDNTATEILETSPAAALSDDEGLIEWFADQLALPTPELQARPPKPGPEAKPAEEPTPPPVEGGDQVKRFDFLAGLPLPHGWDPAVAPTPGQFEDALQLSAIREALAPFADVLRLEPHLPDTRIIFNGLRSEPYAYAQVTAGDLRNLLRAAGMVADEMRPPEATAPVASTEQAGAVPPPATPDETQAPALDTGPATAAGDKPPSPAATDSEEVDQLEVLDVGAADDDEGLF